MLTSSMDGPLEVFSIVGNPHQIEVKHTAVHCLDLDLNAKRRDVTSDKFGSGEQEKKTPQLKVTLSALHV